MALDAHIRSYAKDELIFEEGSQGDHLFVVIEGRVAVVRDAANARRTLGELGKGEFFGEMALVDRAPRSATAIAIEEHTRVMAVDHARFVYLVSHQPVFALTVMEALSRRVRSANERGLI